MERENEEMENGAKSGLARMEQDAVKVTERKKGKVMQRERV